MGRGGQGGGSRNPANQPREVQVSRKVSWLLRHGAASEKLNLGKGGYVNVQEAVSLLKLAYPKIAAIKHLEVYRRHDACAEELLKPCF
jgi:2'-phosphotransferase